MDTSASRAIRAVVVVVLVGLAVVARRPWELLGRPFGAQEHLVAGALRAPLALAADAGSGSPPGWTLLLRALGGDVAPERLRLLPLALAAASVVPAYLLGRRALRRRPLLGGLVAGLVVALAPAMLARQGLRHGTAEGFAAVLLVLLATRLEERFTTRRLVALAAAGLGCVLLAHTAVIVLVGMVVALAALAAHASAWRRAGQLLAVGAVVAAVAGVLYAGAGGAAVAMPHGAPATVPVGDGAGYAGAVVAQRTMLEMGRTGFGPWPLAAPAVALGMVALWHARLRAAALAVPATWLGLLVAGLTGRYPFLEDAEPMRWSVRTSVGLSTLLTMTAAVGVTWVVLLLWRRANARGAVMIALSAAGVFASAVWDAGLPAP